MDTQLLQEDYIENLLGQGFQHSILWGPTPEAIEARVIAMRTALQGNRLDLIRKLCEIPHMYSTFLRYTDQRTGMTLLHIAASMGCLDGVQFFVIEGGLSAQERTLLGETAFFIACNGGHLAVAEALYASDPAVLNLPGTIGNMTPLYVAVTQQHVEVVRWLISIPKIAWNVACGTEEVTTVLHMACLTGNIEILEMLLRYRTLLLRPSSPQKSTPLHFACKKGNLRVAQRLVEEFKKASRRGLKCVNVLNEQDETPLSVAVSSGHFDIVLWLVRDVKADVTLGGTTHSSPLVVACYSGRTDIVRVLVEEGHIDISADGPAPFHICCWNNQLETAKYVFSKRSEGNLMHENHVEGLTPLQIACGKGFLDIVQWLVSELGVPIDAANSVGDTPFYMACEMNHTNVARFLHEHASVDVNRYTLKMSPLFIACANKCVETVVFLIEIKADLNEEHPVSKMKAVHLACKSGSLEILKLLVNATTGDLPTRTSDGLNLLHIACVRNWHDIVRWLLQNTRVDAMAQTKFIIQTPLAIALKCNSYRSAQILAVYVLAAIDPIRLRKLEQVNPVIYGGTGVTISSPEARKIVDDIKVYTPIQLAIQWNLLEDAYFLLSSGIASPFMVRMDDLPRKMIDSRIAALTPNNRTDDAVALNRLKCCCMPWAPSRSLSSFGCRYNHAVMTILLVATVRGGLPAEMWHLIISFITSVNYGESIFVKIGATPTEKILVNFKPASDMHKLRIK